MEVRKRMPRFHQRINPPMFFIVLRHDTPPTCHRGKKAKDKNYEGRLYRNYLCAEFCPVIALLEHVRDTDTPNMTEISIIIDQKVWGTCRFLSTKSKVVPFLQD